MNSHNFLLNKFSQLKVDLLESNFDNTIEEVNNASTRN